LKKKNKQNQAYKKKKKEKEKKKAARSKRIINAVDIHDFILSPADGKEKRRSTVSFFSLYHVGNVKRNKGNVLSFSLFLVLLT